jgi:4'-phosphopantetheinyl transferase
LGRPVVRGPACEPPLHFSLSHTPGLVACAVARVCDVGVDTECLDRVGDPLALADRFFAPSEAALLRAESPGVRSLRFLELWTVKEAYAKACGLGLHLPFASFAVEIGARGPATARLKGSCDGKPVWKFRLVRPTPDHILAIALGSHSGELFSVQVRELELRDSDE